MTNGDFVDVYSKAEHGVLTARLSRKEARVPFT